MRNSADQMSDLQRVGGLILGPPPPSALTAGKPLSVRLTQARGRSAFAIGHVFQQQRLYLGDHGNEPLGLCLGVKTEQSPQVGWRDEFAHRLRQKFPCFRFGAGVTTE